MNINDIYRDDQLDRNDPDFSLEPGYFVERDKIRREAVQTLINNGNLLSGEDFFKAAIIFHHSLNQEDLNQALFLAQKSIDLGCEKSKWLFAAIIDRTNILNNQPQKFGTQYHKDKPGDPWVLYPINQATTDEERAKYNIPKIADIEKNLDKLNNN